MKREIVYENGNGKRKYSFGINVCDKKWQVIWIYKSPAHWFAHHSLQLPMKDCHAKVRTHTQQSTINNRNQWHGKSFRHKKKSKTAIESEWVRALVSDSFILVAWNKSSHINRKESLSLLVAWNFRRKTHEKTKIGWRKPKLLKIIPYLHSPFYIWERQRVWAINQENRNRREKKWFDGGLALSF